MTCTVLAWDRLYHQVSEPPCPYMLISRVRLEQCNPSLCVARMWTHSENLKLRMQPSSVSATVPQDNAFQLSDGTKHQVCQPCSMRCRTPLQLENSA